MPELRTALMSSAVAIMPGPLFIVCPLCVYHSLSCAFPGEIRSLVLVNKHHVYRINHYPDAVRPPGPGCPAGSREWASGVGEPKKGPICPMVVGAWNRLRDSDRGAGSALSRSSTSPGPRPPRPEKRQHTSRRHCAPGGGARPPPPCGLPIPRSWLWQVARGKHGDRVTCGSSVACAVSVSLHGAREVVCITHVLTTLFIYGGQNT